MNLIIYDNQLQQLSRIQDNYSYQVRHWLNWMEGRPINTESIREYFTHLETSGYKARTIANKRAAVKKRIRQLFKFADIETKMKLEAELKEIDRDIKPPTVNSNSVETDKVLSKREFEELINACRTDKQRAFCKFLFATGCRVNEMTGIKLTDCEDMGEYIKITVTGKGKKERVVRIDKPLYNSIRETFTGDSFLFSTRTGKRYRNTYISEQIKKIGALIGRKISAHTLRHSFVTHMIAAHPDKIDSISRYAGHSSVAITIGMYCHTSLSNDELFSILY